MTKKYSHIAIVGSGISGLMAARRLQDCADRITIYEASSKVGGHVNTIEVEEEEKKIYVDTGFIVFNPEKYPIFTQMLNELGVESQATKMGFSVRCDVHNIEYGIENLNTLFTQRSKLFSKRYWKFIRDLIDFCKHAENQWSELGDQTVAEYLQQSNYGPLFADHYLRPIGTALWSVPTQKVLDFPMEFILHFLVHHRMLNLGQGPIWRVIKGGSHTYVKALLKELKAQIQLNTPVAQVIRSPQGPRVILKNGEIVEADQVIFACHANQALRLIEADPVEKEILELFPYQKNTAYLHTDESLMPKKKMAWSSWNAYMPEGPDGPCPVTYDMNQLQGLKAKRNYFVSLDAEGWVDPSKIIKTIKYEHPTYTPGRKAAQKRQSELILRDGLSYCGAYWGFGFHEDGARSAKHVADTFIEAQE